MPFIQVANALVQAQQTIKQTACVDAGEFEQRFSHCQQCDNFDSDLNVCKMCGCYMPWKAQLKLVKCPDGKW